MQTLRLVPQVQALPTSRRPSVLCIENQALPGGGVQTGRPAAALAPSFRPGQKVKAGQGAETLGSHPKAGRVGGWVPGVDREMERARQSRAGPSRQGCGRPLLGAKAHCSRQRVRLLRRDAETRSWQSKLYRGPEVGVLPSRSC